MNRRAPVWVALMFACASLLAGCARAPSLEAPALDPQASPSPIAAATPAATPAAKRTAQPGSPAPLPTTASQWASLTVPPTDYFKPAGKGAQYDIDQETLNGPAIAQADTQLPAPGLLPALQSPSPAAQPQNDTGETETAAAQADGQTVIRAVAVVPVKGAPGSGNQELTEAMRNTLRKAGWSVLEQPRADALTVSGEVGVAKPQDGNQRVAVRWSVASPDGKSLGDVKQANAVPAGSLDKSWGAAAVAVAEAASSGIFDLVAKFRQ